MQFQRFEKKEYHRLPSKPGIYKFINTSDDIIYVGKAKSLKKRVASYFSKSNLDNRKTYHLVREISQIEFVILHSEFDALLLENNLIKENQPRYNILLKDDKSFPSICITNERFPRIYSTRRIEHSLGEYFGPYTSVKAMNSVLDLIRKLNKIRTCKYNLSEKNIAQKKYKICLEYHINNCLGPCEGLQNEESYVQDIQNAKSILKGKTSLVARYYKDKMNASAQAMQFEVAQAYKERIDLLEKFQSKSLVVNPKITDTDVFTLISDGKTVFINYLKINSGAIVNSETVEVKRKLEETDEETLRYAAFSLRDKYKSESSLIISNIHLEPWEGVQTNVPQVGDKRKLIELSLRNALFFKKEKNTKNSIQNENETLVRLMKDLRLPDLPLHIECFDNSNIQGTNPVASMVCFMNGKPSKRNYRKFNIKTVAGPDDFSSMNEIVERRYSKLIKEESSLPNLIVIDGGKGQLNSACDALRSLGIYGDIPIIGIAKKLEEIYFPQDEVPIHLSKKSTSLKLIQQVRDEAHRFAITFHRTKRSKKSTHSSLDEIKGIGPKTKEILLKKFKSVIRIKQAKEHELIEIVGSSKTKLILESLKKGD